MTRKAFSMIELVIAVAVVGGLLAAALTTVGASRGSQFKIARRRQAHLLGEALLAEIAQQPYEDAEARALGTEVGEAGATRANFDDVDDYDGWTDGPPQLPDGTQLTQFADYARRVTVVYVSPMKLTQVSASDTGVKRITVAVDFQGSEVASLVAHRTRAKDGFTPQTP
ncbi:MAG: type IV pilus modification PilV family protein [Planctomycetota bacterium]|jgi:MSHA pilin protein MshD